MLSVYAWLPQKHLETKVFRLMLYKTLLLLIACSLSYWSMAADVNKGCIDCHQTQTEQWHQSDHAKSMALPSDDSVVANFDNKSVSHYGQQARFYRAGKRYMVDVGYDDKIQTLPIKFTFGHFPLQQFLVETEPGRLQVLPFAWDARAKETGGQRWYHNYSDEEIKPADRLHWRQPLQNWNGMCADCHSDGFKRNYNNQENTFDSQWTGINVGCVSCHGQMPSHDKPKTSAKITANAKDSGYWRRLVGQDTASWLGKIRDNSFMDNCFSCHALRSPLTDGIVPNTPFLDQFSPQLIAAPLYHSDGQIKEEVYVYGSFLQSKMYANGVNCLDCHDKHTMKLKIEGNGLCLQCHSNETFNVASHHQHQEESSGAQCVNCHMPTTRYMGVDDRRDHSFKIPRPHVSAQFDSPNACVDCHRKEQPESDKYTNQWAIETLKKWHGKPKPVAQSEHYFHLLQSGQAINLKQHLSIVADLQLPVITRATALKMLRNSTAQLHPKDIANYLNHPQDLLRISAATAAQLIDIPARVLALKPLLKDKVKAVRVAAARSLIDANLAVSDLAIFKSAFDELKYANELSSWRGEGRLNKGIVELTSGDFKAGEQSLKAAIEIEPYFDAAYINLADLYRSQQQPMQVLSVLNQGIAANPNSAALRYSYGLHLIRSNKRAAATKAFAKALNLAPNTEQYIYTYVLALDGEGKTKQGLVKLKQLITRVPGSEQLRDLGIYLSQKAGDRQSYQWFQNIGR